MSLINCSPATRTAVRWLVALAAWAVIITFCLACAGCASPGAAGFRELRRQNVQEKRVLRAVAVDTKSIRAHTKAALTDAASLGHSHLTLAQTKLVDDLTRQLLAVQKKADDLTRQLLEADTVIAQRDATIRQTQDEVKAAISEHWWNGIWLRVEWFGVGSACGAIVIWILRGLIHAGIMAAAVYFPPIALLARKPTS